MPYHGPHHLIGLLRNWWIYKTHMRSSYIIHLGRLQKYRMVRRLTEVLLWLYRFRIGYRKYSNCRKNDFESSYKNPFRPPSQPRPKKCVGLITYPAEQSQSTLLALKHQLSHRYGASLEFRCKKFYLKQKSGHGERIEHSFVIKSREERVLNYLTLGCRGFKEYILFKQ